MTHAEQLLKERIIDQYGAYKNWLPSSDGAIEKFIQDSDDTPGVDKYQLAELLSAIIEDIKELKK